MFLYGPGVLLSAYPPHPNLALVTITTAGRFARAVHGGLDGYGGVCVDHPMFPPADSGQRMTKSAGLVGQGFPNRTGTLCSDDPATVRRR